MKRWRKQAWQRAWVSIRRYGPGRGSRQAVQVGGGFFDGGIGEIGNSIGVGFLFSSWGLWKVDRGWLMVECRWWVWWRDLGWLDVQEHAEALFM